MQTRTNLRRSTHGFTLLEIMISMGIVALIMAIALPSYRDSQEKAKIAIAIAEIQEISQKLEKKRILDYAYPSSLAAIGWNRLDPWGNAYQYLDLTTFDDKGKSAEKTKGKDKDKGGGDGPKVKPRKDKNLKPLNTDFDLFSMGADGDYKDTLSAAASRDDIVRANDGTFIGLAVDY